jgi:hypothetical protein|tara:strand:+ start:451 stop:654 length:204 start_codon:yes stop_codon:yes gene_type:complete
MDCKELIDKILAFNHNSYYVDSFHDNNNEGFLLGPDGFLSDDQLSKIVVSSELYKIIRLAHKIKNKK